MLHIGPDKDLNLFEGIDVERVSEDGRQGGYLLRGFGMRRRKPRKIISRS